MNTKERAIWDQYEKASKALQRRSIDVHAAYMHWWLRQDATSRAGLDEALYDQKFAWFLVRSSKMSVCEVSAWRAPRSTNVRPWLTVRAS